MKSLSPTNYSWRKAIPVIIASGVLISLIYIVSLKSVQASDSITYLVHGILNTAGIWIGCMTIVKFLWKRFPWEHKPVYHLVFEILLITGYTLLFSLTLYLIEKKIGIVHDYGRPLAEIAITLLITYFITAIHEAAFFYYQWKYNFSKSIRLEKANIEANFDTLKAQVNPHFIFNSLNSLTTLVDDNPAAVTYIQNLSGFLRSLLNSDQKELESLSTQMEIVDSYLELLHTRFGKNLTIKTGISENQKELLLPSLVVQMLVENCVKHNIISNDKPLEITIFTEGDSLVVENQIQPKMDVEKSGHGLTNIIERYSYFSDIKPEITESSTHFRVKIPLLAKIK